MDVLLIITANTTFTCHRDAVRKLQLLKLYVRKQVRKVQNAKHGYESCTTTSARYIIAGRILRIIRSSDPEIAQIVVRSRAVLATPRHFSGPFWWRMSRI